MEGEETLKGSEGRSKLLLPATIDKVVEEGKKNIDGIHVMKMAPFRMRGDTELDHRKGSCNQMRRASMSRLVGRRVSQRSCAEAARQDR